MFDDGMKYWVSLIAAAIYVAFRKAESATMTQHIGKLTASFLFAVGLSSDFATLFSVSEKIAGAATVVLGTVLLDLAFALLTDVPLIKSLAKKWGAPRE